MPLTLFASPHLSHLHAQKKSSSIDTILSLNVKTNIENLNYVFNSVIGLRWGLFCGSPEINSKYLKTPNFIFQINCPEKYLIYKFFYIIKFIASII